MQNMSLINEMLKNIPDPKTRQFYADIALGKYSEQIRCMSESCKGKVIGYLMGNGHAVEKPGDFDYKKKRPKSGLASTRHRIDGILGVSCYCGNSSLLAPEEEGTISAKTPSQEEVQGILMKMSKRKKYTEDRFIIEKVK